MFTTLKFEGSILVDPHISESALIAALAREYYQFAGRDLDLRLRSMSSPYATTEISLTRGSSAPVSSKITLDGRSYLVTIAKPPGESSTESDDELPAKLKNVDREKMERDRQQVQVDREQIERDKQQIKADKEQVQRDKEQIQRDKEQIQPDKLAMQRVKLEREQVERGKKQIKADRESMEKAHQERIKRDREQINAERAQIQQEREAMRKAQREREERGRKQIEADRQQIQRDRDAMQRARPIPISSIREKNLKDLQEKVSREAQGVAQRERDQVQAAAMSKEENRRKEAELVAREQDLQKRIAEIEIVEKRRQEEHTVAKIAEKEVPKDLDFKITDKDTRHEEHNKESAALRELQEKVDKLENEKKALESVAKRDAQCPTSGQGNGSVHERIVRVEEARADVKARLENCTGDEYRKQLAKQKELDKEKELLEKRIAEQIKREEEHTQKAQEFEKKCNEWQAKVQIVAESGSTNQANELILEVQEESKRVLEDKAELAEKLAQAEDIRGRLEESERVLKEKVDRLQQYIVLVEQHGMLPEAMMFKRFLGAVKSRRNLHPQIKCFISYAWWPEAEPEKNAILHAQLLKLRDDLTEAGLEVKYDWTDIEGDIDIYMREGIQMSFRVLLICTPRLQLRAAEDAENNLKKELNTALEKQKIDPKFIVPLIFEGDRKSAIPNQILNLLSMDFSKPEKYYDLMTSLHPKGLLPLLLELSQDFCYAELLRGYHSQVREIRNQQKSITG